MHHVEAIRLWASTSKSRLSVALFRNEIKNKSEHCRFLCNVFYIRKDKQTNESSAIIKRMVQRLRTSFKEDPKSRMGQTIRYSPLYVDNYAYIRKQRVLLGQTDYIF